MYSRSIGTEGYDILKDAPRHVVDTPSARVDRPSKTRYSYFCGFPQKNKGIFRGYT